MTMLLHLTDRAPATGSSSTSSSNQVPCGRIFAVTVGADTPILAFTKFISATRTDSMVMYYGGYTQVLVHHPRHHHIQHHCRSTYWLGSHFSLTPPTSTLFIGGSISTTPQVWSLLHSSQVLCIVIFQSCPHCQMYGFAIQSCIKNLILAQNKLKNYKIE